jgi:hypothetical protein
VAVEGLPGRAVEYALRVEGHGGWDTGYRYEAWDKYPLSESKFVSCFNMQISSATIISVSSGSFIQSASQALRSGAVWQSDVDAPPVVSLSYLFDADGVLSHSFVCEGRSGWHGVHAIEPRAIEPHCNTPCVCVVYVYVCMPGWHLLGCPRVVLH